MATAYLSAGVGWLARTLHLPGLDVAEALSLHLVQAAIEPLLPAPLPHTMAQRFQQVQSKLDSLGAGNALCRWQDKVRSLPAQWTLQAPAVDEAVVSAVQAALLADEQIQVAYRSMEREATTVLLHPLALIQRGAMIHLRPSPGTTTTPASMPCTAWVVRGDAAPAGLSGGRMAARWSHPVRRAQAGPAQCPGTCRTRRRSGVSLSWRGHRLGPRAEMKRCRMQNTNSSAPTTMRVHHELSVPSKAISVWMIPSISTPNSVPAR